MRGQGRVFRRGKVWWIGYNHRGQECRESSRSTIKREAGRLLTQRLAERESGLLPEVRAGRQSMHTIFDALDRDIELRIQATCITVLIAFLIPV